MPVYREYMVISTEGKCVKRQCTNVIGHATQVEEYTFSQLTAVHGVVLAEMVAAD